MTRMSVILGLLLFCAVGVYGDDTKPSGQPSVTADKRHEVPGLKLPAPQQVNHDESFITITAECEGEVQWLVLSSSEKIKYKIAKGQTTDIDVGIPPNECIITLFAVGLVDGKMTPFARTDIVVKGPAPPNPEPPAPPGNLKLPLHVTVIEDPLKRTPAIRSVVESLQLRQQLQQRNALMRVYAHNDPKVAEKKLDRLVLQYGVPLLVIQDATGALAGQPTTLPSTPEGVLAAVNNVLGGR